MHVVFAIPFAMENTLRFARAAASLPGVRMSVISQDGADRIPADLRDRLVGFQRVADGMQASDLAAGVTRLQTQHGKVDRLMGILEPLQEPLAEVRERLQIRGMDSRTSTNFRDKARMKAVFADAGIPCARHRLCSSIDEALAFAQESGFPVVAKPPAGAGAKATSRGVDASSLEEFLRAVQPAPGREVLLEEFVVGREFSFDSLTLHGRHVLRNICCYYPTPLEVMDNPWIQWCVVLPRDLAQPEFSEIEQTGPRALDALGMWTGMSHMEWFRRQDGTIAVSEVAARPPGAQFVALMGHVLDVDMHRLYAQLMIFEEVEVPARRYSAGAAYLRGQASPEVRASGRPLRVRAVHGLDDLRRRLGDLIVEAKLPEIGAPRAETYEGDGFLIVRHPDVGVVRDAVHEAVSTVRVELA
ncbi:MAG: ATP-grasp domain-containing protein [Planctomycetota bacterium]|nr:ATP-grasp domain-containing protein [Planctomycetota bacterium]